MTQAAGQLSFNLRRRPRGGKRSGAGRKPLVAGKPKVSHARRPAIDARCPQHVVLRVREGLPNLRTEAIVKVLRAGIDAGGATPAFRVPHWSIQGNHVHLIVEATTAQALSRGMQGLAIRFARAMNRVWQRTGRVFDDHYFARPLRTPTEVRNCLGYVLDNRAIHATRNATPLIGRPAADAFSSIGRGATAVLPRTWLLHRGWLRARSEPHLPEYLRRALWTMHALDGS